MRMKQNNGRFSAFRRKALTLKRGAFQCFSQKSTAPPLLSDPSIIDPIYSILTSQA
jgi:hypothetical protein